eukprot:TRINITY_DN5788_c0_g1_i1.p1 TRINITY_DN5788_c0_g1~~TRINITY_DN5788_c0_g1_i1.p1  ORF type:complete len:449 (-),score=62.81 TRINITY_DN5788_c0_g1_i1:158-1435(-)
MVDYSANNININGNTINAVYTASGGTRWQSLQFTSGLFQASILCPSGATSGLQTSFSVDSSMTISSDSTHDGIGFVFPGVDSTSVITVLYVQGQPYVQKINLGFNCAQAAHSFAIYWDSSYIGWYIDQVPVRTVVNTPGQPYPTQSMFLFGELTSWKGIPSTAFTDAWGAAGSETAAVNNGTTFQASWQGIGITSPVGSSMLMAPPPPAVPLSGPPPSGGSILQPIVPDYCSDHCLGCDPSNTFGNATIVFDQTCGSRFSSNQNYPSGVFSADIMCGQNDTSGLISSFYLSSLEGSGTQDEIDFEFIGKNKTIVQTNVYVNGVGNREILNPLNFDCSQGFHNYAILYSSTAIVWYVDYQAVRLYVNTQAVDGTPYPTKPVYLYASVWDASSVCGGCWAGTRQPWTYAAGFSWRVQYRNVKILSPV